MTPMKELLEQQEGREPRDDQKPHVNQIIEGLERRRNHVEERPADE